MTRHWSPSSSPTLGRRLRQVAKRAHPSPRGSACRRSRPRRQARSRGMAGRTRWLRRYASRKGSSSTTGAGERPGSWCMCTKGQAAAAGLGVCRPPVCCGAHDACLQQPCGRCLPAVYNKQWPRRHQACEAPSQLVLPPLLPSAPAGTLACRLLSPHHAAWPRQAVRSLFTCGMPSRVRGGGIVYRCCDALLPQCSVCLRRLLQPPRVPAAGELRRSCRRL